MAIWARMRRVDQWNIGRILRSCLLVRNPRSMCHSCRYWCSNSVALSPSLPQAMMVWMPSQRAASATLIDCGLAVRRNVQEPRMSPRNQAGRLRVFFQPLEQFLKRPLAVVPVLSRTLFRMSHDDALLAVCEGLVPILQLLGLIADVALITVGIQNPLLEVASTHSWRENPQYRADCARAAIQDCRC